MNELPKRKPNRLKDYDYGQNGAYFVTICAKDRLELFATIDVGATFCRPCLTHVGKLIENEISVLSRAYKDVFVDHFVVMPNHVHMIIGIQGDWRQSSEDGGRQNVAPTVSRMIKQWKRAISIKSGCSVWQKSFHDHVIRDEDDYLRIAEYIENNPQTWKEDCFYAGGGETIKSANSGRQNAAPTEKRSSMTS